MRVPVPETLLPADQLGTVHFVGIGGAGLSGIARIMIARGITVTGSDAKESRTIEALRALGATCFLGHDADNLGDADTVVVSTAVRENNPEVVAAWGRGLRLLPRSAALESVMQGRVVVAVAGTHGKTTTTSLLTVALQHCAADPSFAIGGELNETGSNAHDGSGELFVAEADESDGAFLVYSPHAALVTNVEADHLDNYGTEEAYRAAFDTFVDRISPEGFLVVCADDPGADALGRTAVERGVTVVRVGERADADVRAEDVRFQGSTSSFVVVDTGRRLGEVTLQIPGRHYVLDALAALACGLRLGFGFADLARGLGAFSGTRRRMELKGQVGGVRVYDSYAHHPNEIAGDLQAARSLAGEGRVVVAFQPHMVSRTRIFGHDMGVALGAADDVVVMDIYVAREDPEPGVTGALVADAVPLDPAHVVFETSWSAVAGHLVERARPGDVVLTLGAGDVTLLGPEVLELLGSEVHPMSMRDRLRRKGATASAPVAPPPSTGPDEETVRIARKDFRRRRNAGRWRRLRLVLLALLLVATVSGSVWVVFFSSYVTARDVDVTGTTTIGDARIERAAQVPKGTPLARVDLGAIKARVESIAAVKSVEVSRSWPHAVHIEVTERTAIAVINRGEGLQGLDDEGVMFGHYATRPKQLPLVIAPPDTADEALVEGGRVIGSLPPRIASRVDTVEVQSVDEIELVLANGRRVLWGSADESGQKAEVLAVLLRRPGQQIDVSVPGRPTTR